jgi:hypothetical protein
VDIAADDHDAACVDLPGAIQAWRDGLFTLSGRPPKGRLIDDFEGGSGRTFYVGTREGGKLCRVYEKGKQLGDPQSKWRAEVELHARIASFRGTQSRTRCPTSQGATRFRVPSLVAERIRTLKRGRDLHEAARLGEVVAGRASTCSSITSRGHAGLIAVKRWDSNV